MTSESRSGKGRWNRIHESDTFAKGRGEGIKDVDGRIQPFRQLVVAGRRLFELLYLGAEDGQDVGGRVAGLQLDHQWMHEKVFLGLLLILFDGSIEDGLEIGRGGRSRWSLRHRKNRRLILVSWLAM